MIGKRRRREREQEREGVCVGYRVNGVRVKQRAIRKKERLTLEREDLTVRRLRELEPVRAGGHRVGVKEKRTSFFKTLL